MMSQRAERRWLNLAGVVAVVSLMAYALYAQYVLHLEACPLCIFQRVALIVLGFVFLAAVIHGARGMGARVYAVIGLLTALVGAGISGRHLYLQSLPPDRVPACGPGLDYILDAFPLFEAVRMVFTGSGECATVNWSFLGLAMPGWVLIWFVLLGGLIVVANWKLIEQR
jgi:protein dithiol:quinone oxidoreductase